ncbi:MAG: SRPBCC family protein [Alphaproteobacteria bacterium]|nr:SRPBCC family protein [Alphaproteobacteria bacterium]
MIFLLCSAIVHAAGLELSAQDLERVDRGEVVVLMSDDGTESLSAVEIAAPPGAVFEAILDFSDRVERSSMLKRAEVYARGERSVSVKFEAGLMGFTGTWHSVYAWDEGRTTCTFDLDDARDNSLTKMEGRYDLEPVDGGTRMVIRTASAPGGAYPKWLIRSAGRNSSENMLLGLRERATKASQ